MEDWEEVLLSYRGGLEVQVQCVASFKLPTMQCGMLQNEDILHEGYRPKMLLYTLEKLFYIYDQVKHHRGINEKLVMVYEILSIAVLCCMEC